MKKLFLLTAMMIGLFLVGCQDSNNLVGPENTVGTPGNSVSFLKLPASLEPRPLHKPIPFLITPQSGGVVHYSDTYQSAKGPVTVDVKLNFPPGAVSDSMIVVVDISNDQLTGELKMDFGPSPTSFLKPALLTFTAQGLDPASMPSDASAITFVFMDNGNYVPMTAKKISINLDKGELNVLDGEVPHFSRYGWAT